MRISAPCGVGGDLPLVHEVRGLGDVVAEADLFGFTSEGEGDHLGHVEDGELDVATELFAGTVLLEIHVELAEGAGGDHHVGVVVDRIEEGGTAEGVARLGCLEIDVEAATFVFALIVHGISFECLDEIIE